MSIPTKSVYPWLIGLFIIPIAVQWWSVWYPGAEPGGGGYIAQRMFAAKDEKNSIGATFLFNVTHYALRPWPWIVVALASLVVFPDLASLKEAFPHVPEGKRLFPKMSVRDNLLTGAHLRTDKAEVEKDLEKAIEYFPILGEKLKKPASTLSGGQQQMLAFGRALLSAPKLFLFDEPSLGLAPIIVRQIGERIKLLADEGFTVILVEQNATLALELANAAYVLETGKVAMEGDADRLKNNEYVKKVYLGI